MAVDQVFRVLTEFRFEVGSAVASSGALKNAVEGISQSAEEATFALSRMTAGLAAQMSLGTGGILGGLGAAIKSADKFQQTQIAIANLMNAQANPFQDRMAMAAGHMEHMNKLAAEFALPTDDLINMTKLIAPMIRTHGKDGAVGDPNFSVATDVARNFLKAAPTLGIDPTLATGQLQRMVGGQASMGDTLFSRLVADTSTMGAIGKKGGSKAFNALPEGERIQVIMKSLKEFTSDAQVLAANVNTLRGQMQLLKDAFTGTFSIMRPFGEMIQKMLVSYLVPVNAWLRSKGAFIGKEIARMIQPLTENPERVIATLMGLRDLKKNLDLTGTLLATTGAIIGLHHAMMMFGIKVPLLSPALHAMNAALDFFGMRLFMFRASTIPLIGIFDKLVIFASNLIAPLILIMGVFQLISRAIAIARIADAKAIADLIPKFATVSANFMRLIDIFNEGFNKIAEVISPIFRVSGWFELLIDILDGVTTGLALAVGGFQGLLWGIMAFIDQIKSGLTGGGFSMDAVGTAFDAGVNEILERVFGSIDGGTATVNQVQNIAKVEINQQFKEQQQPDRIAFALKDQLTKIDQNRTSARGRSFAGATLGG